MPEAKDAISRSNIPDVLSPATIPDRVRALVGVAPAPEWVLPREVDENYRPPGGGSQSTLLIDRQRRFSEHVLFERVVRRVETLQGVQEAAQWRLDFDPATQHVELHTLSVRRQEEVMEHARPERMRLVQREENFELHELDAGVTLIVFVEDVRVGDIVDVSYSVRTESKLFGSRYWMFATVPWSTPIRAFHLRVLFPKEARMQWKSDLPGAAPAEQEIGGETEWSWKLENTAAIEEEPDVPAWHFYGRWFQVSDFESWGDVASGLLIEWVEDFGDELERMAEQIAGEATLTSRAERALILVQDEIRYLVCKGDFGGNAPSGTEAVLQRRFGDCKDKTSLLVHLLRRLGIPARAVLVHSEWRQMIGRLLPMPDAFDHAVVEYEIEGERRWCDATLRLQGGGPLGRAVPPYGLGLPISSGVRDLEAITSSAKVRHTLELNESFHLDTAGRSSTLVVVLTASGAEADTLRSSFALEGAEVVARTREKFYQGFFPELKQQGELQWRDNRERNEFVHAAAYEVQKPFAGEGRNREFTFHYRAHLVQSVLALPSGGRRRLPLLLRYPCEFRHVIELFSPALTGKGQDRSRPPGRQFFFEADTRSQTGRVSFDYTVKTTTDAVDPADYTEHSRVVRELWPSTEVEVKLRAGVALPRRLRIEDNLPPDVASSSRRKATQGELEAAALPAEPAPLLASRPDGERPPRRAERVQTESPPSRMPTGVEAPSRPILPTVPLPADGRRRRPRAPRPKRSSGKDQTWLLLLLVIGLVFVAVLVAMSMNKK